jgi:hypothetical protein
MFIVSKNLINPILLTTKYPILVCGIKFNIIENLGAHGSVVG